MLPLGRRIPHKHLVAGLAATLQVAALTADAVALEARKTQKADDADTARPEPEPPRQRESTGDLPDHATAGPSAAGHPATALTSPLQPTP